MNQNIKDGRDNVQIIGENNTVIRLQQDDAPTPGNPNLITCPACEKYGIYRYADKCPRCQYSFEQERQRALAEEQRKREVGAQILAVMGMGVVIVAVFASQKLGLDWKRSLGLGAIVILGGYTGILFLSVGFRAWSRR